MSCRQLGKMIAVGYLTGFQIRCYNLDPSRIIIVPCCWNHGRRYRSLTKCFPKENEQEQHIKEEQIYNLFTIFTVKVTFTTF